MNKFNISKALMDTVSGIVSTSKTQQAEQNTQFVSAMREKTKIETIRPLTVEQLAAVPKREPKDLGLHNAIRQIASTSATQASAEQQTAEGRINSMYRVSGGRGRGLSEAKAHTVPKTSKDKDLAALAEPKDKITHADVMVGRGVKKEEMDPSEKSPAKKTNAFDYKTPRKPQDAPDRKSGDTTATGHNVKRVSTGMVYTKKFESIDKQANEGVMATVKKYAKKALDKVGHGSDEDMIKDLQKKMGMPQTGKKPEVKEDIEQVDELSRDTLLSYANKVSLDSQKHSKDPTRRSGEKANRSVAGYAKAHNRLEKPVKEESTIVDEAAMHPMALHVQSVKADGATKYKVHAVGKDLASGIKVGEHLTDTHLDDAAEMGAKIKHVKEEKDTPGNGYEHQCALHVKHAKLGEGKTLFSQHADPDEHGAIAWYDVMFNEGIVRVDTQDLEILVSEAHMNHKKKM